MDKGKNEFLGLLCNLYLVALLVALPLYTGQGYWQLGNTKYALFRNITLLCLGCWLVMGMPDRLRTAAGTLRGWRRADKRRTWEKTAEEETVGANRNGSGISGLDIAVAAYSICVLVSAFCSSYKQLAWYGYEGWFMGAFSQLLFVGIYFFVSRQYDGASWPLCLGAAALFLVTAFGLLHRLGVDPLGLLEGWNSGDWEYSHMLSTLGNINWLCGYYSVALAFLTVCYLLTERLWVKIFLYMAQVCAFVLLGIQGSQSGLLILAVCVGVSLWLGRRRTVVLARICLVLTGFFAGMPLMWGLMRMRGKKAAIVADGNVFNHTEWYVWVIGTGVSFALFLYFYRREKCQAGIKGKNMPAKGDQDHREGTDCSEKGKNRESRKGSNGRIKSISSKIGRRKILVITSGSVTVGIMLACCLFTHPIDDGFGSGRGFLWRIALESFAQADWKGKLLGVGPDCYGEAVFNRLGVGTEVWKDEHWDGAVFTNAHNEFLSQLCNVGILGTVSYLAIFAVGLCSVMRAEGDARSTGGSRLHGSISHSGRSGTYGENTLQGRRRRTYYRWLGILALWMYGMHSLVSFQQVLNTPLLFMALGLCEAERRKECSDL